MIARIWRGATAADRADEYLEYLKRTGVADYTATPGNHGVQILTRTHDGRTDFTILSYWESLDAIKAFAGDDPEASRFYPEDDEFLIHKEPRVEHHDVADLGAR
jgi:heme-degrading monooxygenase HmoA